MRRSSWIILLVVLVAACLETLFWASVASVSAYTLPDCTEWTSSPPGRFLPWPEPPGIALALSRMSPLDQLVCRLYRSGDYVFLAMGSVLATGLIAWLLLFSLSRARRHVLGSS